MKMEFRWGRVYWLLLLPFIYLLTMTDFFHGIASLGYLGFIFFICILVALELYLFFDGGGALGA